MSVQRPVPSNPDDYTDFGDVAISKCNMQCQYCRRYLAGEHGSPDLGSDLRWFGDTADYHGLQIHKEDVDEFVRRVLADRHFTG